MTGMDILLIVIGAILIAVSFLITEKLSGHEDKPGTGREIWSDRDEMTVKDRVKIVLADKSEQIINDTEERLCHLSNEKIMEFQEFSDQVNEQLNENHNQSVFLYKMLTEKQNEMKEWMSEIDSKYAKIKDELNTLEVIIAKIRNLKKKQANNNSGMKPVRTGEVNGQIKETNEQINAPNGQINVASGHVNEINERIEEADGHTGEVSEMKTKTSSGGTEESRTADTDNVPPPMPAADKTDMPQSSENRSVAENKTVSKPQDALMSNKNEKILELFDSGKSLVEISKQLGIGQGEVKLVLDLYRGNKK